MSTRSRRAYGSGVSGDKGATFDCKDDVCVPVKGRVALRTQRSRSTKPQEVSEATLAQLRAIMADAKGYETYDVEGTSDAVVCPKGQKMDEAKCAKRVPRSMVHAEASRIQKEAAEAAAEESGAMEEIAHPSAPVNEYVVAMHLKSAANTQVRLLTRPVGQERFQEPGLFSDFGTLDFRARYPVDGVSGVTVDNFGMEQYVEFASNQVLDWSSEDARRMLGWFQNINDKLDAGGMRLTLKLPQINIIKTTGKQEPVSKEESQKRIRGYLLTDDTIVLCWDCITSSGEDKVVNLLLDLIAQMMIRNGSKLRKYMLTKLGMDAIDSRSYVAIKDDDYDLETRFMQLPSDWPVINEEKKVDYVPVLKLSEQENKAMLTQFPKSVRDIWNEKNGRWMVVTLAAAGNNVLSNLAEYSDVANRKEVTYIVEPKGKIFPYRFVVPVLKEDSGVWEEIKTDDSQPVPLPAASQRSILPQYRIASALEAIVANKKLEEGSDAKKLRSILVIDEKPVIKSAASAPALPAGPKFDNMKIISGYGRATKSSA